MDHDPAGLALIFEAPTAAEIVTRAAQVAYAPTLVTMAFYSLTET